MKVSVITPAYNAEKYLAQTLDSIMYQTMPREDYEVIVINGNSTDDTEKILKEYSSQFPNLKFVTQENLGPAGGRNAGMKLATGDFFYFLDADDMVAPDSLECFYDRAIEQKADLVIAGYDIYNGYSYAKVNNINRMIRLDEIDHFDKQLLWTFSLWNKFWRAAPIRKNHLEFPALTYSEDGVFLMKYLSVCGKVTGMDQVVIHYRRMNNGEQQSITTAITPKRVEDYLESHRLMREIQEKELLKRHPDCTDVPALLEKYDDARQYLSEFSRKELQTLLNQFYIHYWNMDEVAKKKVTDSISDILKGMELKSYLSVNDNWAELDLFDIGNEEETVKDRPACIAVLYGEETDKESFLHVLTSLSFQNLVHLKIFLPSSMKEAVMSAGILHPNMFFLEASSEEELHKAAIRENNAPYILFCSPKISYQVSTVRWMRSNLEKSSGSDYIVEVVYHNSFGTPQPVHLNDVALGPQAPGQDGRESIHFDFLLANKIFRSEFVDRITEHGSYSPLSRLPEMKARGYALTGRNQIVYYAGNEKSFPEDFHDDQTLQLVSELLKNSEIKGLSDDAFAQDKALTLMRLEGMWAPNPLRRLLRSALSRGREWITSHVPLKNQVLFFTIRDDGRLEGNAAALYPYVEGKKVIAARRLPHPRTYQLKMMWEVMRSKVIVTDDYVRYLRYFPLQPEQKVIQLWHACGAFKKFGRYGTNLSQKKDLATHVQYSLVCVSGEEIRTIYADSFGISREKVRALGDPRTDLFFDKKHEEEVKQNVYQKYPQLKGKRVVLYAPTFRDAGGAKRAEFHPELDFPSFSKKLPRDMMFVIRPHPIMTTAILSGECPNILEIRDFSTNDLMFVSDLMVTDYSSVVFEYSLLKKPILFFCYDLAVYNRGFYLRYPEDLPGDVIQTQRELERRLCSDEWDKLSDSYDGFVKRYMSACDGHSSERIAKLINQYMEGNR